MALLPQAKILPREPQRPPIFLTVVPQPEFSVITATPYIERALPTYVQALSTPETRGHMAGFEKIRREHTNQHNVCAVHTAGGNGQADKGNQKTRRTRKAHYAEKAKAKQEKHRGAKHLVREKSSIENLGKLAENYAENRHSHPCENGRGVFKRKIVRNVCGKPGGDPVAENALALWPALLCRALQEWLCRAFFCRRKAVFFEIFRHNGFKLLFKSRHPSVPKEGRQSGDGGHKIKKRTPTPKGHANGCAKINRYGAERTAPGNLLPWRFYTLTA